MNNPHYHEQEPWDMLVVECQTPGCEAHYIFQTLINRQAVLNGERLLRENARDAGWQLEPVVACAEHR
jgi:hypothetical protein